jgi:hypothetical protein
MSNSKSSVSKVGSFPRRRPTPRRSPPVTPEMMAEMREMYNAKVWLNMKLRRIFM